MSRRLGAIVWTVAGLVAGFSPPAMAGAEDLSREVDRRAAAIEGKVVAWQQDLHQHPELGNREVRTAKRVAEHLESLGFEVQTGVAHTGVVGLLRGAKPGPVVALRADMDALPVTEEVDVPYASKVRTTYRGQEVGVMHACGHDIHTAALMGAAEVLAGLREQLPGTVKLIFQPAEEGAPAGEEGGAQLMVKEGVMESPHPDAVFGLHTSPRMEAGQLGYRAQGALAAADGLTITIRGRQTHAAMPWLGVDPIVVASQVVLGLQTIASRQVDATLAPAVISIGSLHGGVRGNIIPDEVEMWGTIRTFDPGMREEIHDRVRRTAESIAAAAGATAEVAIEPGYPVTYNDPELTRRMAPTLERVVGEGNLLASPHVTGAEDFSFFQQHAPGLYFFLGVRTPGTPLTAAAPNHSPRFYADPASLPVAVRAMAHLAVDFLTGGGE